MNHFTVDVLTPNKVIAKDVPCESLLIPTVRGQINVLAQHTHIVNQLGTGQLSVFGGADDVDRHFSITHGICKVLENKITILSNTAEETHEIDGERARRALDHATQYLADHDSLTDDEITKFQRKIERANLRIQMAEFVRDRK